LLKYKRDVFTFLEWNIGLYAAAAAAAAAVVVVVVVQYQ